MELRFWAIAKAVKAQDFDSCIDGSSPSSPMFRVIICFYHFIPSPPTAAAVIKGASNAPGGFARF